jgi:hypothetical protein
MTETERIVIPVFPTEAEEAAWWDSHRDLVEQRFLQAAAAGTLGRGRVAKRAAAGKPSGASPTLTLRVPETDISRAQGSAVSDVSSDADSRRTGTGRTTGRMRPG